MASKITVYKSKWNDDKKNIKNFLFFWVEFVLRRHPYFSKWFALGGEEGDQAPERSWWWVTGSVPWLPVSVQCESLHLHRWLLLPTAALQGGCGDGYQCVSFAFTPSISRDSVAAADCNTALALSAFLKLFISVISSVLKTLQAREFFQQPSFIEVGFQYAELLPCCGVLTSYYTPVHGWSLVTNT